MNPNQARVTALEAIEAFRVKLLIYLEKAGRVLDEIHEEVVRTRVWLEHDQRSHWEQQIRRRARHLDLKQQELFSARFAELAQARPLHQAAVRDAKRELTAAEEKLARVRRWRQQFDGRVAPVAKEVDKLREVLNRDMRQAAASLGQTLKTLEAYAGLEPSRSSGTALREGPGSGATRPPSPSNPSEEEP